MIPYLAQNVHAVKGSQDVQQQRQRRLSVACYPSDQQSQGQQQHTTPQPRVSISNVPRLSTTRFPKNVTPMTPVGRVGNLMSSTTVHIDGASPLPAYHVATNHKNGLYQTTVSRTCGGTTTLTRPTLTIAALAASSGPLGGQTRVHQATAAPGDSRPSTSALPTPSADNKRTDVTPRSDDILAQEHKQALALVPAHMRPPEVLRDTPIARKWRCIKKIGSGSFGEAYLAMHVKTGQRVAVKIESLKARHPQLLHEARILRALQGHSGFPKIYYYGTHMAEYAIVVMELLGSTLEEIFVRWSNRSFSTATVAMIGTQMIDRIEALHSENYIHRDIKPDNFLVGPVDVHDKVYMIDFGLSKRYRDPKTNTHIPYCDSRSLTGTARYVSLHAHMGVEPSRRDDAESCGFLMVYFLRGGQLPWQGLKAATKHEKYAKILQKKMSTSLESLTEGLPTELYTFLKYCRKLAFDQGPDYQFLRGLLASIVFRESGPHRFSMSRANKSHYGDVSSSTDTAQQKSFNSRECETADTLRHRPVILHGGKISPYADYMAQFQSGLERSHFERTTLPGMESSSLPVPPPSVAALQQKFKDAKTSKQLADIAVLEHTPAKKKDPDVYKSRKQRQFFCMNCQTPGHPTTTD